MKNNKSMSNELAITTTDAVVLKKRQNWADMGQLVHQTEQTLQSDSLVLLSLLVAPTKTDELLSAESTLKEVNKGLTELEAKRKERTSVLDAICTRLMNPEKVVKAEIEKFKAAIVSVKKLKAVEDAKIKAAADELSAARAFYTDEVLKLDSAYKKKCADNVLLAYNYALGDGNITMDAFTPTPVPFISLHGQAGQIAIIASNLYDSMRAPVVYLNDYYTSIDMRFEFYNVAVNNKQAAQQQAAQAKAKADADAAEALKNAQVAATLENVAVLHTPESAAKPEVKALKQVYELDMPDNETSALAIISAFVGNFAACRDHVRVKSFRNLSVEQMGAALCALKNKDNAFSVNLITFKVTDKL